MASGLTDKHKAAIDLLLEGRKIADVAKVTGLSTYQLYDLQQGNTRAGAVAVEFQRLLVAGEEKQHETEKFLVSNVKRKALEKVNEWLDDHSSQKPDDNLVKKCISIIDKVNKAPSSLTLSNVYNLNGEELVDEFKRLSKLAKSSVSNGRGIS